MKPFRSLTFICHLVMRWAWMSVLAGVPLATLQAAPRPSYRNNAPLYTWETRFASATAQQQRRPQKTSPPKNERQSPSYRVVTAKDLTSPHWHLVKPLRQLEAAQDIPPQRRDWSCGLNSSLRAGVLAVGRMDWVGWEYDRFITNAPQYVSRYATAQRGQHITWAGMGLTVGGLALAPVTGGSSFGFALGGLATSFVGIGTMITAFNMPCDVGPSPQQLTRYLNHHLRRANTPHRAHVDCHGRFVDYAHAISQAIHRHQPVIILLVRKPLDMHYVNVIGVYQAPGEVFPQAFAILNTNQKIYTLSAQDLRRWTKNTFSAAGSLLRPFKPGAIGNYTLLTIKTPS